MSAANAAFSQANGANIVPVGNTMSNGYYTVRSSKRQVNFIPGSVWDSVNVDTDASLNTSNITITTNLTGAFTQANIALGQANLAWDKANLAYTFAANNAFGVGNAAFAFANSVNANAFSALAIAIAAYAAGNTTWTYAANNVQLIANLAYGNANTTYTYAANQVMLVANLAFGNANTTYTYAANVVMTAANSAFTRANIANLRPVGNTMSNGYYTIRATRNQLNFIPGGDWVTINVNDDPSLNTANAIITANLTGAFTQANLSWDKANLAYTFAANNAFLVGNSAFAFANGVNTNTFTAIATSIAAYAQANTDWTYAANNVQLIANSAYGAANIAYTYAANNVQLIANLAFGNANSTYTYAANNVMSAANAAFAMANAANLMPVGNTMANGYWTIRSTKRRINFIPGSAISITVDDDPSLNTANVTISAVISGGDPTYAFTQANAASLTANSAYDKANSAVGGGYFQGNNGNTGSSLGLGDIFRVHTSNLNTNTTITSGNNALAAGPISVFTGVVLTIQANARVSIV
jgi:hypothetical protein